MKGTKNKGNGGITLIALIVTIMVLLTLSGISIVMLVGDNGIMNNGKNAKILTNEAEIKEQVNLLATEYIAKYHQGKREVGETTVDNIVDYVAGNINGKTIGENTITVASKKITVTNLNGQIVVKGRIKETGAADFNQFWEYATENGKTIITDGTVKLNIGDKIDYDPADGATTTTYTSLAENSGYNNDQVFNVSSLAKTSGENWRVLGVDEKSGQILIIPENFVGPTEGGATAAGNLTYYYINEHAGYVNGVSELNKISELYGQGKYATGARSITADDVNKITGFNPTTYGTGQIYEYNNEVTYSKVPGNKMHYMGSNGVSGLRNMETFLYYDENIKVWREFGPSASEAVRLTSTYYSYKITNSDVAKVHLLAGMENGGYYFTDNGAKMNYWLSSPCVIATESRGVLWVFRCPKRQSSLLA